MRLRLDCWRLPEAQRILSPAFLSGGEDPWMTRDDDFLARGLRDSSLIALAPTLPGFLARTAHGRRPREGRPHPGRRAARRRQRRHQHGRPLQGRGLRQAPQGDPPAREAADQDQRRGRPAPGDGATRASCWNRAGWRSCRAWGIRTRTARTSAARRIWQSARLDERDHTGLGWVGRGLDGGPPTRDGAPAALLIGPDSPPPAIRGRRSVSAALDRLDDYALTDKEAESRPIGSATAGRRPGPVPAPQPAGRLHHGRPPRGRRRGPRRRVRPIPSRSWPGGCS